MNSLLISSFTSLHINKLLPFYLILPSIVSFSHKDGDAIAFSDMNNEDRNRMKDSDEESDENKNKYESENENKIEKDDRRGKNADERINRDLYGVMVGSKTLDSIASSRGTKRTWENGLDIWGNIGGGGGGERVIGGKILFSDDDDDDEEDDRDTGIGGKNDLVMMLMNESEDYDKYKKDEEEKKEEEDDDCLYCYDHNFKFDSDNHYIFSEEEGEGEGQGQGQEEGEDRHHSRNLKFLNDVEVEEENYSKQEEKRTKKYSNNLYEEFNNEINKLKNFMNFQGGKVTAKNLKNYNENHPEFLKILNFRFISKVKLNFSRLFRNNIGWGIYVEPAVVQDGRETSPFLFSTIEV